MKKIYLVDSENVGDVWVPLLISSQPEDEVYVFYTQKSPYMNYENVRILKETEKEAVFIKCFEGNNALDFQLVTELGYMLRGDIGCEYIIVSNDTGFDAVARYWSAREMFVRRLNGKECSRQTSQQNNKAEGKPEPKEEEPKAKEVPDTKEAVKETEQKKMPEDIIKTLFFCIGKDNLADFHNALVMFLGEKDGKKIYQELKSDMESTAYWSKLPSGSQKEKFEQYCRMVFEHSELADSYPKDFSAFLYKANEKRKNLNSLRAALQGQYGKEKGMKYYSLFKSHIKIMNRM